MLTLDRLREYGANVDEGLGRCMNMEAFYLRMVGMGLADPNFDKLAEAMEARDAEKVFAAVHALKGAIGNLALTPIYTPICELTELLRGKAELADGVDDIYARIVSALDAGRALLD